MPHKGYKQTEEVKRKKNLSQQGDKNHMWGKHHSDKTKKKISLINFGKKASEETKQKMKLRHKEMSGKHHSLETKKKMSLARWSKYREEKHPQWKGGKVIIGDYIYIYKLNHPLLHDLHNLHDLHDYCTIRHGGINAP